MSLRIPPALSPYIQSPLPDLLYLLTGVQNASPNWLVLRYLYAAFGRDAQTQRTHHISVDDAPELDGQDAAPAVLLVSWLRDLDFWQTEAKRAVGIDLSRMQQQNRFAFIDGLRHLYTPLTPSPSIATTPTHPGAPAIQAVRQNPIPLRGSLPPSPTPAASISTRDPKSSSTNPSILKDPTLATLEATITASLARLSSSSQGSAILILDAPSLLLCSPSVTSSALLSFLLRLRAVPSVRALILSLPADAPLLAASPLSAFNPSNIYSSSRTNNQSDVAGGAALTPLDTENAAFVVGAAYQADLVLACRSLGTGWAEDVSGAIRVSRGGNGGNDEGANDRGESERPGSGGEWLYYIEKDGGARVWRRGGMA